MYEELDILEVEFEILDIIKSSQNMRIILILEMYFYYLSVIDCKKDKTKCECGIPLPTSKKTINNARIFNGKDAAPNQFPWQVFFEIKVTIDNIVGGGAVLVSKKHILTCAHAFYDKIGKRYFS